MLKFESESAVFVYVAIRLLGVKIGMPAGEEDPPVPDRQFFEALKDVTDSRNLIVKNLALLTERKPLK